MSNMPSGAAPPPPPPEPLEVLAPDAVGRLAGRPDVVLVVVDGGVPEEVHRADDVVPVAPVEELGHTILAAGDEVGLDAELEVGLLAHERAVGVEVVGRALAPELMVPDLERLREAVDVLGDSELRDAAL